MKVISYSLFGFNQARQDNCFDFNSYLRGLMINVRLKRLLFPEWDIFLYTDEATDLAYGELFRKVGIYTFVCEGAPLCKKMLWRMKPCFMAEDKLKPVEAVVCRDVDSPLTYRDRQAVEHWLSTGKAAHAITDSISHTVPMMGGMIGFIPKYFTMLTNYYSWEDMLHQCRIDFNYKGSDQDFLNQKIYPKFAKHGEDSIIQHYVKGMPNTYLSGYFNHIPDIDLKTVGIPDEMREAWAAPHHGLCGHIGAAGHYSPTTENFLRKYKEQFEDIKDAEREFPDIFYWIKTNEL